MTLDVELHALCQACQQAARRLARTSKDQRTDAIMAMAYQVRQNASYLETVNRMDQANALHAGISAPLRDRLGLGGSTWDAVACALEDIARQPDPVGLLTDLSIRPNGLKVSKMRIPLGVVLLIYESRPHVTLDAAALCIRSGNAVILRGGSEAVQTNTALAALVHKALISAHLPPEVVLQVPTQDRTAIDILLGFDDCIDVVIPRGGEALIRHVVARSRIPVIRHAKGICHIYVGAQADHAMAENIVENAKVQRPGVCNALDTLLVDAAMASDFLPSCVARLQAQGVEIRGCAQSQALVSSIKAATPQDWDTEFLDWILAVRIVENLQAALDHIEAHGTQHTAAIVSCETQAIERFIQEVDASCVLVNASSRFNDGGALGLGAEIGISTSRVHAYGPMGAMALTTEKFVVQGQGQIRG